MTDAWVQLRSAAMLGLARRPPGEIVIDGIRPSPTDDSGARFLTATALATAQRRAGLRAASGVARSAGAPAETQAVAPSAATHLLELILGGALGRPADARPLLAHWLSTARAADRIVPPTLVVSLLDAAIAAPELQASIAAVAGERGRWLAGQRDDWATAFRGTADSAPLDDIDALSKTARLARLRDARRTDPAAARAWIDERWDSTRAGDRAIHVAALEVGLGPDDEPLLERALDDRSVAVREAGAKVLDRLPMSGRGGRLVAALAPLVDRPGRLRRKVSVRALPAGLDLSRDLPGKAIGSTLLRNLLVSAPLRAWTDATGLSPRDLLRHQTDPDDLVDAWTLAAVAQRDEHWLRAIIGCDPAPRLVGQAIIVTPGPWDADLSRAVLTALRRHQHPDALLDTASVQLAERLHESTLDEVERWRSRLGAADQPLDRRLRALQQHLSTRRSITEAFT